MKLNERTTAVFWHRVDIRFETVAWCLSLLKFKTIRINELCNYTVFNNQIKVESRRNEREEWSYLKISPIESVNWRTVYVQKFRGLCFSSCVPSFNIVCAMHWFSHRCCNLNAVVCWFRYSCCGWTSFISFFFFMIEIDLYYFWHSNHLLVRKLKK